MTDDSFDHVLRAAARLQTIVPDAVLVGGAAAAHYAGHRVSLDDDHVVADLRDRFDTILADLEATKGWVTARVNPPVLILGSLDGIETGVRQLIRMRPLEVDEVVIEGHHIRVPTIEEILRIKAWLVLRRNATRDYLDVVALADRVGISRSASVLLGMDHYYEDQRGPGGLRIATQVARQLADPAPYDLSDVDLARYRDLSDRWRDWQHVVKACRDLASDILDLASEER
jgi:hypothetical protein